MADQPPSLSPTPPRPEATAGVWGCGSLPGLARLAFLPSHHPSPQVAPVPSLARPRHLLRGFHAAPTSPALVLLLGNLQVSWGPGPFTSGVACGRGQHLDCLYVPVSVSSCDPVICRWPDEEMPPRTWEVTAVHVGGAFRALGYGQRLALQTPLRPQNPQPDLCCCFSPGSRRLRSPGCEQVRGFHVCPGALALGELAPLTGPPGPAPRDRAADCGGPSPGPL